MHQLNKCDKIDTDNVLVSAVHVNSLDKRQVYFCYSYQQTI